MTAMILDPLNWSLSPRLQCFTWVLCLGSTTGLILLLRKEARDDQDWDQSFGFVAAMPAWPTGAALFYLLLATVVRKIISSRISTSYIETIGTVQREITDRRSTTDEGCDNGYIVNVETHYTVELPERDLKLDYTCKETTTTTARRSTSDRVHLRVLSDAPDVAFLPYTAQQEQRIRQHDCIGYTCGKHVAEILCCILSGLFVFFILSFLREFQWQSTALLLLCLLPWQFLFAYATVAHFVIQRHKAYLSAKSSLSTMEGLDLTEQELRSNQFSHHQIFGMYLLREVEEDEEEEEELVGADATMD